MATIRDVASEALGRVDASLLAGLYTSVSVSPRRVRRSLRVSGRPFLDPDAVERPSLVQVDHTARWVVEQSGFRLGMFGGVAGTAGAASVPPEVVATTIAGLRLAQRLAIVYGFDPHTDRGEMAVWRALAGGFEVELPGDGPVSMRVSDLPGALVRGRGPRSASEALATAVVRESASMVGRRLARWLPVPLLSSGLSATAARDRMREIGERMRLVLRRLAEAPAADPDRVEDAVELG